MDGDGGPTCGRSNRRYAGQFDRWPFSASTHRNGYSDTAATYQGSAPIE